MVLASSAREAAAAAPRQPPPTTILTIAERERVQGLAGCEETVAAAAAAAAEIIPAALLRAGAGAYGRHHRDWSALPDLALTVVAGRLHTLKDFLSFRCVCTSWRSVGAAVAGDVMASQPPLLFDSTLRRFYHMGEKRIYMKNTSPIVPLDMNNIVGVSHSYLILSPPLSIVNPLTGAKIKDDCFPRSMPQIIYKALLSSPPTSHGCVLVVHSLKGIQFCRLGVGGDDKEWCTVRHRPGGQGSTDHHLDCHTVLGLAVVRGTGYAALRGLGLASFDLAAAGQKSSTVMLTLLKAGVALPNPRSRIFADQSNRELFALPIMRLYNLSHESVVEFYRFDTSSSMWVKADDLGGRAVIVDELLGTSHGTAEFMDGTAIERWGGSKDCIYWGRRLRKYNLKKDATPMSDPSCLISLSYVCYVWTHAAKWPTFWVIPRMLLSSQDGR